MRMWNTDPSWMCDKHLLGSHVELHMFIGAINNGVKIDGYINNNLVEPLYIKEYHAKITAEMVSRGMNHKTPLKVDDALEKLDEIQLNKKINREESQDELLRRCSRCRDKFNELRGQCHDRDTKPQHS